MAALSKMMMMMMILYNVSHQSACPEGHTLISNVTEFFGGFNLQSDGSDWGILRLNSIQDVPGSNPGKVRILSEYCPSILRVPWSRTLQHSPLSVSGSHTPSWESWPNSRRNLNVREVCKENRWNFVPLRGTAPRYKGEGLLQAFRNLLEQKIGI